MNFLLFKDLDSFSMMKHAASLGMEVLKNSPAFNKCCNQSALSSCCDIIGEAHGRHKQSERESALSIVDMPLEV